MTLDLSPELMAYIGSLIVRSTCDMQAAADYAKARRMELEWVNAVERDLAEERDLEIAQEHMLAVRQAG